MRSRLLESKPLTKTLKLIKHAQGMTKQDAMSNKMTIYYTTIL